MQAGIDAVDVPTSGLGAAVAASDVLLLEAVAAGPDAFLAVSGSLAAATVARHAGVPVWVTAGVGRWLPARMWTALQERRDARPEDPWDLDEEAVPFDLVDLVCTAGGLESPAAAVRRTDCPVAPELFDRGNAPGTFTG
jgi:translation initiation factor 2B subunit (eIF-2B alpha/beta/delta family)